MPGGKGVMDSAPACYAGDMGSIPPVGNVKLKYSDDFFPYGWFQATLVGCFWSRVADTHLRIFFRLVPDWGSKDSLLFLGHQPTTFG